MTYRAYRPFWLRCNECRTRRTSIQLLLKHQAISKDCKPCKCGGYHHPHRPGSPYCESNPRAPLRHALRVVETDEDVLELLIEWSLDGGAPDGVGGECPF
jgi:hypothetical protein